MGKLAVVAYFIMSYQDSPGVTGKEHENPRMLLLRANIQTRDFPITKQEP